MLQKEGIISKNINLYQILLEIKLIHMIIT